MVGLEYEVGVGVHFALALEFVCRDDGCVRGGQREVEEERLACFCAAVDVLGCFVCQGWQNANESEV